MPMSNRLPVLEVVPNVSVGRDDELVAELEQVTREALRAASVGDAAAGRFILADVHADEDHDRTVFTLVGSPDVLLVGMDALARASVAAIDLHAGHGVHPRIGVVDVVPVVALGDDEEHRVAAFALAAELGRVIGDELRVPCVRYGLAQDGDVTGAQGDARPERIQGAGFTGAVRRGGGPAVLERVAAGELELLAGPAALHPTAGVTMVGVREVLIAFNVDLAIDDLDFAREVARAIREVTDGPESLHGVRALGLRLPRRHPAIAQVSTNIERHARTGPAKVLETVARLAQAAGVSVDRAELVGLAPDSALAPLRYTCTRLRIPLVTGRHPSLEAAVTAVGFPRPSRPR
jgi:glutamate formiminotransferase